MSVESFSVSDAIQVTPAAAEHFAKQLQQSGKAAVRLSLKESGCTGYMYVIDEVDSPEEGDLTIALPNDVAVYVDPSRLDAIRGTVVDYRLEGINRNLILDNPNVKAACGCGESFNV